MSDYYQVASECQSKGCVGVQVNWEWGTRAIRMSTGPHAGKILRFNKESLDEINKARHDDIVAKGGATASDKKFGVIVNGVLRISGVAHSEAAQLARELKLKTPPDYVAVFKVIGVAQEPVTTVEIK